MDKSAELLVYGARFSTVEDARMDMETIKQLHRDEHIGRYDAALATREADGKVKLLDTDATEHGGGAWIGGISGALIGVIFPPALVASTAIGATAGAAAGTLAKRFSRGDAKDLAELLEPGQSGILLVTDWVDDAYRNTLFSHALTSRSISVSQDEDLRRAIRHEATLHA